MKENIVILRMNPAFHKNKNIAPLQIVRVDASKIQKLLQRDPDFSEITQLCNFFPQYGDYVRMNVELNQQNGQLEQGFWSALIIDAHDGSTRLEQVYERVLVLSDAYQFLPSNFPHALFAAEPDVLMGLNAKKSCEAESSRAMNR